MRQVQTFEPQAPEHPYPDPQLEPTREPWWPSIERKNVSELERLLSVASGAGLIAYGLGSGKGGGLLLSFLGGALVYRGVTGRCQCYAALGVNTSEANPATAVPARAGCKVEKTLIIQRPAEELFSFWREVENLPTVMRHVKKVEAIDRQRSHWVAEGALGRDVQWDAEIFNERENELIAWRSLPGGDVDTAGSVRFKPLSHDLGTEVSISLKYNPPMGKVGATIATLLGEDVEQMISEDLRALKWIMETGETPTSV